MAKSEAGRFWEKVEKTETCWLWNAGKIPDGYGVFVRTRTEVGKRAANELAHRYAYLALVGEIGDGMELDHLCGNRACVDPTHLEAVTHRENVLRGDAPAARQARQTHCHRGHEFVPGSYYLYGRKRRCKQCASIDRDAWRAKQREAA